MSDSREPRASRDRDDSRHLMDAFGRTADLMTALDPVTGLTMKGAELAWRFIDRKIAEEARQRQG
jgi:hypothetical protein